MRARPHPPVILHPTLTFATPYLLSLSKCNSMASKVTKFKVAAAHAAPVFMNKAATIKKVVSLIEQAAKDDVKLLVFPETFVPGYPVGCCPINACITRVPAG